MRACVLVRQAPIDQRPLEVRERAPPSPRAGEVLVAIGACGICRTDLHVIEGDLPQRHSPLVPGHQVVGRVVGHGDGVSAPPIGARVGVAWLHRTCGGCRFCGSERENLCAHPEFTGWTVDGGFAELMVAPAAFVHALPDGLDDVAVAPLLCAGIIGYRALRLTGLDARRGPNGDGWRGARLGIYGFGAAGHLAIQLARHRGAEVFVATRDRERHQALAKELGAAWVGDTFDRPDVPLDAAIVFAPAGEIVPAALAALDRGGTLVLGGIHMSPTPPIDYDLLWHERVVRSVANNTRDDARAFLAEAARANVRTHVTTYRFDQANEALVALKHDAIRGAAVLSGWAT
ncbi:MAG: zinc-dependent alcohol dehydrogenase family protein [Phycisphaerales bacterium]